jgi:4-hydroxybenzoate polyprenyltransferase
MNNHNLVEQAGASLLAHTIREYLALLRPHQYVKNLFIFLPLFFALHITDSGLLLRTFIAFAAFCLVASSIYVLNDYCDVEEDRNHPKKRGRPFAAGTVSIRAALPVMACLLISGYTVAYYLNPSLCLLLLGYYSLNLVYNLKLKHIPILDIFVVSSGFVIRLFAGSLAGNVHLSMWIILMTFLLALFIALAKRRDDVLIYAENGNKTRKVVDGYNVEFLNTALMIMASITIVAYIMYTVSPDVVTKMGTDKLYMTLIFVLLGFMRYLQITLVEKRSGSPTEVLLKDKFLQSSILGWIITFLFLIYT